MDTVYYAPWWNYCLFLFFLAVGGKRGAVRADVERRPIPLPILIKERRTRITVDVAFVVLELNLFIIESDDGVWN